MVNSEVCLLEDRSKLELVRSYLIVACLTRDAKLESLNLKVAHKCTYTLWDRTEVVVVHLLILSRRVSHEGTASKEEVRTCRIEALVNEEVLLLPTEV